MKKTGRRKNAVKWWTIVRNSKKKLNKKNQVWQKKKTGRKKNATTGGKT